MPDLLKKNDSFQQHRALRREASSLLNPVITRWANYHWHACPIFFYLLDRILWRNIWNVARRRHNNLGYRKIVSLIFIGIGSFSANSTMVNILLRMFACFPIKRHRLINGNTNPFDTFWDKYFAHRVKNKYAN